MAWTIEDRFPDWGESGQSPPDGFRYEGGDQVNEKHLDYYWNSVEELFNDVRNALIDIDSDQDGVVDEADDASLYKGNDIDSDGDGVVNEADDASNVTGTYKGNDIDSDGDGVVNEADDTSLYKGNDIDSDGDGVVNEADDTSLYKGNDIDSDGDGVVNEAEEASNVTGTYKGNDIDSDGDGVVDEADNVTSTYKGNDIDSDADGTVDSAANALQFAGLSPSDGSNGQFLQTDGTSISWVDYVPTLSDLTVDANKNWQSYNITNVGVLGTSTTQTDNYVEGHTTASPSGGSLTVDIRDGNVHRINMDQDASISFSGVTSSESNQITIRLVQDGNGNRTPSFNNVRWQDGAIPSWTTDPNAIDVVSFVYDPVDGVWDGFPGGFNMGG